MIIMTIKKINEKKIIKRDETEVENQKKKLDDVKHI